MASIVEESQELVELRAKITAQGDKVRELKTAKADGAEIKAAVAELLALKSQLPESEQPKKKEKKKKDPNAPNAAEERARKKAERRAARYAKEQGVKESENFGKVALNMSRDSDKTGRTWTHVKNVSNDLVGKPVLLRGYVQNYKATKTNVFLTIRKTCYTVQCVVTGDKDMVKFASKLARESIVDVEGEVCEAEVKQTTQSTVEIKVSKLFVINESAVPPLSPVDAAKPEGAVNEKGEKIVTVGLENRLDNRFLDLRTPVSQAVFRVSSTVCSAFRDFLVSRDFIEIQTPKLLGGQSEGGAEVFMTDYFGRPACLAQSPQLHKQISAACSGFERVFEIGPVFRAENSQTGRHLCEFHGLDMEMAFNEHYHEVLDMFSDVFHHVFNTINEKCKNEIEVIRAYTGFEDLVFEAPQGDNIKTVGTTSRTLYLTFPEAIAMLREAGVDEEEQGDLEDFSTPVEKKLGKLVKEKYGVDFYFLDKFPVEFRPFYTMPDPANKDYSNSYDFFIRGQEILSGAQRVHDPDILTQKVREKGIPPESIQFYIDAFKYGAMPHGGGGVGLERVVMLFLELPNIRMARLFPRDPLRLTP